MKTKTILTIILVPLLIGGLVWAFLEMRKEHEKEPAHEEHLAASHAKRSLTGEPILTLDEETQKRIGLKIATLKQTNSSREAKAYGRVLDSAPLVALANEIISSEAAYHASSNELVRLKTLEQSQNASARAIQIAEAAARRDQVVLDSARAKLTSAWGNTLATLDELPALARSLARLESALIRADLPVGEKLKPEPTGVRIAVLSMEDQSVEARLLGPAPTVDPQTQMPGFLLFLRENQDRFIPGSAVIAYLKLPGEPVSGAVVPRDAVVRAAGRAWVYVQSSGETFSRREIELKQPLDNGWFVPSDVAPKEPVVVVGAQQLLSEELKSQIKEAE
jgi:hypothetical protein